ncbi:hypothetical protein QQP08_020932 [Theobroma cacao]|nr:hypothetical protein QQP08_020932 [Theobroma cacao]
MVGGEELSLYGSAPNNTESAQVVYHSISNAGPFVFHPTNVSLPLCVQKTFLFAVRDSLTNVGPLKDFSYGLRINADASATGIAKQSNYELKIGVIAIDWMWLLSNLDIAFNQVLANLSGVLFWLWKERCPLCSMTVNLSRNDYRAVHISHLSAGKPHLCNSVLASLHAQFCHLQVEPTGSKGIRTVYHKRTCSHSADLPPALYQFCHDGLYLLQNDTIQKLL